MAGGDAPVDGSPTHGATGSGGFIQFPAGAFSADPQSSGTYDLAVHKWLPVKHAWISPDGSHYAWPEYRNVSGPATGIIHVTDAATGADRALNVPAPSMPVSWETSGLYITRVVPNSDAPPQGLSVLDPATGSLRQVVPDGVWTAIGTDSAYGADLDASIPPPPSQGPGGANRVRAVRLDTAAVSTVQSFPGQQVSVLGVQGSNLLLLVTASGRTQVHFGAATIYDQPASVPGPSAPAQVDGSTIWLSGGGAVWRATGGGQLERFGAPLQLAQVAGACR